MVLHEEDFEERFKSLKFTEDGKITMEALKGLVLHQMQHGDVFQ